MSNDDKLVRELKQLQNFSYNILTENSEIKKELKEIKEVLKDIRKNGIYIRQPITGNSDIRESD